MPAFFIRGPKGDKGDPGAQGVPGAKGDKGDPSAGLGDIGAEKRLAQIHPAPGEYVVAYTVPSGRKTVVKSLVLCNVTDEPISVRVHDVSSGQSPTVENALYYGYEVPANWTYTKSLWLVIPEAGDTLVVWASATGITFTFCGAEAAAA